MGRRAASIKAGPGRPRGLDGSAPRLPPGARDCRAQPNVMGHGHVRDGRLGGLFHGLLRGVGGSGEENGGLHGANLLQITRRATVQALKVGSGVCARVVERLPGRAEGSLSPGPLGFPPKPAHPHSRARARRRLPRSRPGLSLGDPFALANNHDTTLTTQLGRRNEEGPLFHETSVFRSFGSHRRVHFFGGEAARRVGVEGPHLQR